MPIARDGEGVGGRGGGAGLEDGRSGRDRDRPSSLNRGRRDAEVDAVLGQVVAVETV